MKGFNGIKLIGRWVKNVEEKENNITGGKKPGQAGGLRFPGFKGFFSSELLRKLAPKKTRFAAVDIGSREIKVVEVSTAGGDPEVTAFGRIPTPPGALDGPVDEEALVNALNEVLLTSGIQLNEVITTISGDRVITRHIMIPLMPEKELKAAVRFETEKFIPIPVQELTIRYLKLGQVVSDGVKYLYLLLAAVPTTFIYKYYGLFARAGLIVAAIDLQSLSLWRVFCGLQTHSAGTVGLLDIGASTTQFLVVRDRALQFTRSLPVGGNLLTSSLAEHYGFEFEEAQRVKETEGLLSTEEAAATASPAAMQIDFSLRYGLSGLVREIRRSIDYYMSQENATAIERFIISGGTSKLKGFRDFFAEAMDVPVDFGDPSLSGQPGDETEAAPFDPAFAVVLGTALREVVE